MSADLITAIADEGLGNSSYVVDLGDRRALVVDPERDPAPYLAATADRGLRLAYVAETHLHADFVSGSRELAAQGAKVLAAAAGHTAFPHRGLDDGTEVDLGGLTLRALATPGHTPEHLSYLLLDGRQPQALFSGGSLLVGAVARTDLIAPGRTEELARQLWRSLQERILTLPDGLAVYPTHGAGSFCSAPAGSARTTTIGAERATSPLLGAPSEDAFVGSLLAGLGTYPPYFSRLREVNRRGPAVYGPEPPALTHLDPGQVRSLADDGAAVVDVRPIAAFAVGHIPGSLSIPLRDQFATWLGWLVAAGRPSSWSWTPSRTVPRSSARRTRSVTSTSPGSWPGGWWRGAPPGSPAAASGSCRPSRRTGPSSTSGRTPSTPPGTSPAPSTSSSGRSASQASPRPGRSP